MWGGLIVILCMITNISASHFVTKHGKGVKISNGNSQSINAQSPIECLLKCQNKWGEQTKGFFTKENSCLCSGGGFTENDADNGQDRLIVSKRDVQKVTFLDEFEIDGRKYYV